MPKTTKEIRYLNRDFDTLLTKLVDYAKYYYPNSFNDFSPASPAMILMQMMSYVGDVLNFYIDKQTKQSILYYATQKQSVYNIAQSYGYKIKTATPATVQLELQCFVPALKVDGTYVQPRVPDFRYAPVLHPGTTVGSSKYPKASFTILEPVNFKKTLSENTLPTKVNQPSDFIICKVKVPAYSLMQKTFTYTVGTQVRDNIKIYLPDSHIVKVISVTDSKNQTWYQTTNLANDSVINPSTQYHGDDIRIYSEIVTNKRFRVLINAQQETYLYFGNQERSDKLNEKQQQLIRSFNTFVNGGVTLPSMLLLNNNYGECPYNTTLTIKYLVATSFSIPSNVIDQVYTTTVVNSAGDGITDTPLYQEVVNSIMVTNTTPSIGGTGIESIESIKENTMALIGSQDRLVTDIDYKTSIKRMPSEYGDIAKSHVQRNMATNKIEIYVLSYNNDRHLVTTPDSVKTNLGEYLMSKRVMGDFILIDNAKIINVGCQFKIVANSKYSKRQILLKAIQAVKEYMNIDNFEIGTVIDTNLLRTEILQIQGVSNILGDIVFINKVGGNYSLVSYNMANARKQGVYYTSRTPSIFELKYPDLDIVGSVL